MNNYAQGTARGLIDLLGLLPNAARVASAMENGKKPDRSDLQALGLHEIIASKQ